MFKKLLSSIAMGIFVAVILLLLIPALRKNGSYPLSASVPTANETPFSFNQAVRLASPAVVNVYNRSINHQKTEGLKISTLGAGVIMNAEGYILTNKHVISNADQIIVALQDARVFEATLVGSDTLTDLAVLKIQATELPTIAFNPERVPHVGDVVLAIGNPYNLGQTVTQGIISATGRNGLSPSGRQNFLQTDASINHGNSGGALVNSLGELIGINTLSFDKSNKEGEVPEGIGFAIPAILASKVMDKLIRDGRVIRGYIGIEGSEVKPLKTNTPKKGKVIQGIIVGAVNINGPAAKAGILPGDVIIEVNNKPALTAIETMDQIAELQPGAQIPILILRGDKTLERQATVAEYPLFQQQ
jgi:serine protease DegS